MKDKKVYVKPALRKVRLEVKHSVLSTCHTSNATTAQYPQGCVLDACFYKVP